MATQTPIYITAGKQVAPFPTGDAIGPANGGTGVANNAASTITISGSFALTITLTGTTSVTFPTTGTLATLAGAETFSGKTLTAPKFVNNGFIADANGNEQIIFVTTASAVNEFTITNAATGIGPIFSTSGETGVPMRFLSKGVAQYHFHGQSGNPGAIFLYEDSDNGNNYITVVAETAALGSNFVISIPAATGTLLYGGGPLGTPSSGVGTNLTGTAAGLTAGAATILATTRNIGGSPFNGSADITSFPSPGAIGGGTPAAGTFTTGQFTSNVIVDGNLTVNGTTVTQNVDTFIVEDPLVKFASGNAADAVDTGFYAVYTSSGAKYTGLFRDATDGKYKLFTALEVEPTTTVNIGGTGYAVATLVANLEGTASTASAVAVGGITGLGTGVATALAINVGSAGAVVLFDGAGGTPSSLTLTNATGLPIGAGTTGTLGADRGGTGVANNAASTITISGSFALTVTLGGTTSVTFPTSGTLVAAGSSPSFSSLTVTNDLDVTDVLTVLNLINLGHASDTTLSRTAAGKIAVEGVAVPLMAGSVNAVFAGPTATRTYTFPDANGTVVDLASTQTLSGKTLTAPIVAILKPVSDSTTAVTVTKADGSTAVVTVDTTNSRVGIGGTPTVSLDITPTAAAAGVARLSNASTTGFSTINFTQSNGNTVATVGFSNSSASLLPDSAWFGTRATNTLHLVTNDTAQLTITNGGNASLPGTIGTASTSIPTLGSTSIFTNKTLAAPTFTGHALLAENAAFQLDTALSADGTYCGWVEAGTAGATLAFGDLVYQAAADSRWELTDANAAATAGDVKIGICVLAAASDGSATVILLWGKVRADAVFPSFSPLHGPVHISETAGDVTSTAPTTTDVVVRRIGWANTADELFFCPSNDYYTHV